MKRFLASLFAGLALAFFVIAPLGARMTLLGAGKYSAGGGAASLTFTASVNPATVRAFPNASGSSSNLGSVTIGPSQNDRYFTIACSISAASADAVTATIGGNSMTNLAEESTTSANRIIWFGRLINAAEQAGTTATLIVSYTNNSVYTVGCAGGYITGSATIAESGTEVKQADTYGDTDLPAMTAPSDGVGLVFMCFRGADGTASWGSGLAGDYDYYESNDPRNWAFAHATTLGSSITPTNTGYGDHQMAGIGIKFAP